MKSISYECYLNIYEIKGQWFENIYESNLHVEAALALNILHNWNTKKLHYKYMNKENWGKFWNHTGMTQQYQCNLQIIVKANHKEVLTSL